MGILARLSTDPKSPGASRVSTSSRTLAGVAITPDTAVTIATVWACLRYLSQTVAVLPWHVVREVPKGAAIQNKHPIDWLLYKRPNPEWSSFQFRETLTHWALRHGNGYAEIEPDQNNRPFAMWPIHPERCEACRSKEDGYSSSGDEIAAGELFYEVNNGLGDKVVIAAKRMFHIRGFGEGPVGVNVINYAAQSLGWARAAQLYGATFFGNGMNASGFVTLKKPLKEAGFKALKAELDQLYKGVRNANKAVILDNEADFKAIGIDPRKSQLLELHQHLVEEICRWFGVPPHKVMHLLRATFSNIEHQAIEVVVDSVTPWVKRFEDEADYKLFGQNRSGLYTKMNLRALLRGDFKSQNEGLEIARRNGVVNADEWRDYLAMNRMKDGVGGDKYVMQSHNTTLERIGEEPVQPERGIGDNGGPPLDPESPEEQAAQNRLLALADRELESV